ncbi:protocadherin gamma-A5-like [Aplysia californica]|uniref:Protocadherin gamma-A5-like n=1 Tax=Aplysia californica TaxID=6500 RepID=A0ABM1VXV1_APLCA|nr:protocadherin gamma-A5-like [Aplysia californica]
MAPKAASVCLFFSLLAILVLSGESQIILEVQEEQGHRLLLGNIGSRANISNIPGLRYSLVSERDRFEVDETSGDFYTRSVLDREQLCGSVPRCVVSTSVAASSDNFFQRYNVEVVVMDANDQRPRFSQRMFSKPLSESAAPNSTMIRLPVAEDADYEPLFRVQGYHLEPRTQRTFDLVVQKTDRPDGSSDFDVSLRLLRGLNREVTSSFSLVLVAKDGDGPDQRGTLPIEIVVADENDNEPEFTEDHYTKKVKESTAVNSTVLTVSATDADKGENARVSFEFPNDIDRTVRSYFAIDQSSGALKLLKSLVKEGGSVFSFRVKAYDHGLPSLSSEVEVRIDVEDTVNDPPSISVIPLRPAGGAEGGALVAEDASLDTRVALVDVTDSDSGENGRTSCSATSEYFSLQADPNTPGAYTVSVSRPLNRESDASLKVEVSCTDYGTPPLFSRAELSVIVEDVNDHEPEFSRTIYEMEVKENQEIGELVGSVLATDLDEGVNGELRYSLEPGIAEFDVNELNGFIYTRVKNLDRETTDTYRFEIYAFDVSPQPLTATATVVVRVQDLNDVWPRFDNSSYKFSVSESLDPGVQIGRVLATDKDLNQGGVVQYLLVHSVRHPDPPFAVSVSDGSITLTKPLDREMESQYNFVVTAFDLGIPPRNSSVDVQITILDENDNAPVIAFPTADNLSVTLNLDVTPGHEIIKVIATDQDAGENGRLTFSLNSHGNASAASRLFWINEDTGLMTLAVPLTPEDVRVYNVVISVHDHGAHQQRATRALLQVEVVQALEHSRDSDSNITIVIIMVCFTLVVAVVVLVTLCFIKYIDKKKFDADRKNDPGKQKLHQTSVASPDSYERAGSGDDVMENGLIVSPSLQKQPPSFSSQQQSSAHYQHPQSPMGNGNGGAGGGGGGGFTGGVVRNGGKKSVTFDSEVRTSDSSVPSECLGDDHVDMAFSTFGHTPETYQHSPVPVSLDSSSAMLLPNPAPFRTAGVLPVLTTPTTGFANVTNPAHSRAGSSLSQQHGLTSSGMRAMEEVGGPDEVIDVALQKHNALVRSMRGNGRRPQHSSRQVGGLL